MTTWLYVDRAVASLQMDLDTAGNLTLLVTGKQAAVNRLPSGLLRVLIYSMDLTTFSGRFAEVDAAVTGISGVTGANPDGTDGGAGVTSLGQPVASIEVRR